MQFYIVSVIILVLVNEKESFLADRTNGRAIATLLRLSSSSSSVCLWRYVL